MSHRADFMMQGTITSYVGLELSLLILVAVGSFHATGIFIASSVLKLVSALFMVTLSALDHSKSPRPSVLLNSYLFLSLLLDAAQARTLFLSSDDKPELTYSSIFCAALALKAGILLLEAHRKTRWVQWNDKEHSPEETSGIFSLGVFFWLNDLFMDGYSKILTITDLYPLDTSLNGTYLHGKFVRDMESSKLKGDKFGLVKVLIRTLKVPLLLPIPPRLALLGFTICQPLFIEKLLDHLSQPVVAANVGYGFIGASILIYSGIAISTALYWYSDNQPSKVATQLPLTYQYRYFHHRMRIMARSILVTETFIKATKARIGTGDDSAALTLMSTDMERIQMGLREFHDIWASIIQAAVAGWMLHNRLGLIFLVPMGVVLVCSIGLGVLTKFTGDSQRSWMAGVQKRVGLTATVIAGMKNLKISGLCAAVSHFVQRLRVEELAAGARFRKIDIIAALLGFTALLMSPPLTFAFAQRTLDAPRMFTSLSYLLLLTSPLSEIFQGIPSLLSALACLGRMQKFLECETRHDFRQVLTDMRRDPEKSKMENKGEACPGLDSAHSVVVTTAQFGWEADRFALRDVNFRIAKSSLSIVVGPVGSGKSTLCKALLGEIPFSEGSVVMSTRFPHVGFCDQTAFLSNESVRDNIIGFSPFNHERYAEVIEATALEADIATLPQADRTRVGSDGITLSGGQRQRVSLARALYLQSDLIVLDDIFSGLDADTEEKVFRQVFGPDGLLRRRRSTVVLCTHSIRHLPAADHIIALGEGTVSEQGTFDELMTGQGYVQRLGLGSRSDCDTSLKGTTSEESIQEPKPQLLYTTTTDTVPLAPDMDEKRRSGDNTVYIHYIKSMGWFMAAVSLLFGALWGFFANFPTICESTLSSTSSMQTNLAV